MQSLGNLLNKLFQSAMGRILSAFGISFVSFTSYQQGLEYVKTGVSNFMNSLPADVFMLVAKSGITDGLGYLIGRFIFVTLTALMRRLLKRIV